MKRIILPLVLMLISIIASAEKAPIKFGKVEVEDLQMKVYDKDTSASAVILCDYGVFSGENLTFTRVFRIKILKKEGLDWANKTFPYGFNTNVKGITYNLVNGEIEETKLRSESIFKEKITQNHYQLKVAMPDVRVGSVIDLQFSGNFFPDNWYFQQRIPVKWSELRIYPNAYVEFKKNYYGFIPFSESSQTRWVTKDVPAFITEPFTNSSENFITKFEFEILRFMYDEIATTYEAVFNELNQSTYFGEAIKGNLFLLSTAKQIKDSATTDYEKLVLAYEDVRQMNWNHIEDFIIGDNTLSKCYKDKIGNSADINLILISLLKKLDIKAEPILLSTRSNGLLPFFPTLKKFNYVICRAVIDDKEILLDATDKNLSLGMLPVRCLNGRAQLMTETKLEEYKIVPDEMDKIQLLCDVELGEDKMIAEVSIKRSGYNALRKRDQLDNLTSHNEYIRDVESTFNGLRINELELENVDNPELSLREKWNAEVTGNFMKIGESYYIEPLLMFGLDENMLKNETRKYPVDFAYKTEQAYYINFHIPDGYEVKSLPESTRITLPDNAASVVFYCKQLGNKVSINYSLSVNKILFMPEEYVLLRKFYDQIIAKQSEPIVLNKL